MRPPGKWSAQFLGNSVKLGKRSSLVPFKRPAIASPVTGSQVVPVATSTSRSPSTRSSAQRLAPHAARIVIPPRHRVLIERALVTEAQLYPVDLSAMDHRRRADRSPRRKDGYAADAIDHHLPPVENVDGVSVRLAPDLDPEDESVVGIAGLARRDEPRLVNRRDGVTGQALTEPVRQRLGGDDLVCTCHQPLGRASEGTDFPAQLCFASPVSRALATNIPRPEMT
jgi:hypothetical protein